MGEETTETTVQGDTEAVGTEEQNQQKTDETQEQEGTKQTTETKEGEQKSEEEEKTEEESVPEKYEDFNVPEGVEVNQDMLGKFTTLSKELSLSQENAQKLIDLATENAQGLVKAQHDNWSKIREGWVDGLKKDSEFGGDAFDETTTRAKRTLSKYGSEDLTSFLEDSGFGDNAEVIKMFARIDKALGEDKVVDGKPSNETGKSAAEVLYPNS